MMMAVYTPGETILVVDDTPSSLGMLTSALEEAGYMVLVAPDGQKALDIAARITPNAVLMDAVMPDLDGFETSKRLKKMSALQDVPVVFMTGLSDTENIVRGLEAGGVDYITKPVNAMELLARLKVHIANARSSKSAHFALDASGRYLLSIDLSGNICWSTSQARSILGIDWGDEEATDAGRQAGSNTSSDVAIKTDFLPGSVVEWLRQTVVEVSQTTRSQKSEGLYFEIEGRDLQCAYVGAINSSEHLIRVSHRQGPGAHDTLRSEFGLTEREAEVLTWITNGKSNKEIATILDMSPRTVNKHLDRIFSKLGVENRTAAAILSLKRLQD
ncbi:DNA-binding response regulator [Roseibium algae]|uniref:DNA-binding response regulator n=1 Tax=Roseibium algae TaxID=3123038 RepID=A0ABU8TF56_9HYPH